MLKLRTASFAFLLIALSFSTALAQEAEPQIKTSDLGANNSSKQPSPSVEFSILQKITEAIANAIERADEKHDAHHHAPPPDNSSWWFNLFLVVFSGCLVIVGGGQCYLVFHTLRATQKAANAARHSAEVAERALIDLEGPFLYPVIEEENIEDDLRGYKKHNHPSSPHSPKRPEIRFKIKNIGRSHAFPQSITAVFFWGLPEDIRPDRSAGFIFDPLIEAGHVSDHEVIRKMDNEISGWDDYIDVMNGVVRIYLRGSIIFSDTFGNRYEQTYCLTWGPVANRFMAWGPSRNKRKRISGPQNYAD